MGLDVNDIILISMRGECLGQTILNQWHLRCASAGTEPETYAALAAMCTSLRVGPVNSVMQKMIVALPPNYFWKEVRCQRVYPTRSVFASESGANAPGTNGADALTPNVSGVLSLYTNGAGRHNMGRTFIGPLPGDQFADGLVDNATLALFDDVGSSLTGDVTLPAAVGTFHAVIWSPAIGNAAFNINHYVSRDSVRVMHRRTLRVGI